MRVAELIERLRALNPDADVQIGMFYDVGGRRDTVDLARVWEP